LPDLDSEHEKARLAELFGVLHSIFVPGAELGGGRVQWAPTDDECQGRCYTVNLDCR